MTFSRHTLAEAVVIAFLVASGVWYARDPDCNNSLLSCFKGGAAAKMSQVDVRQIDWSADVLTGAEQMSIEVARLDEPRR